jgi:hypothetical protein
MTTARKLERKPRRTAAFDVAQSEFVEQIPGTVASLRFLAREDQIEAFAKCLAVLGSGASKADKLLNPFFDRLFMLNGADQSIGVWDIQARCWHELCLILSWRFSLAVSRPIDAAIIMNKEFRRITVEELRANWPAVKGIASQFFLVPTVLVSDDGTETPLGEPTDHLDHATVQRVSLNVRKERLQWLARKAPPKQLPNIKDDPNQWPGPYSHKEWHAIFAMKETAFRKKVADGLIRLHEVSPRRIRIHPDDVSRFKVKAPELNNNFPR